MTAMPLPGSESDSIQLLTIADQGRAGVRT
jgi:hypothetical protein